MKLTDRSGDSPDAESTARITALEDELAVMRSEQHRERREAEATVRQLLDQVAAAESDAFSRRRSKPGADTGTDAGDHKTAA